MKRFVLAASGLILFAAAGVSAGPPIAPPPVAQRIPVTDDYYGTKIVDPYRWMETRSDPRFVAWLKAEDAHARAVLAAIPGVDALQARIAAHGGAADRSGALQPKVALSISTGGSENGVMHVVDTASGTMLPDAIDRVQQGSPSWLPDGSGFFHNRSAAVPAGAPETETEKYFNSRAMLHRLGTDPARDTPLIGTGLTGSPAVTKVDDPFVAPFQPGKMAAHLQAATSSGRPILLRVDFDAGHGMGSTRSQRERELAEQLAFLYWQIGRPAYQPR